ncbi:MAG TPA: ABC transporter permease [Gaiellaceae bacterium]|nr:ABC transporter permease [Gaiellaceae bacterium]
MRRAGLILGKDLRVLRRSPLLLAAAVGYPLVVAVLVALVGAYAGTKPRVALVDEAGLPPTLQVGNRVFGIKPAIDRAGREVHIVRLTNREARHQLDTGRVVAIVRVPHGFVSDLRAMVRSPQLELETSPSPFSGRIVREVQAFVYALNRELQGAYIGSNLEYVNLLQRGGKGTFLGRDFDVLGLGRTDRLLATEPQTPAVVSVRKFVRAARLALAQTGDALRATANPIALVHVPEHGRTWAFSAQVQAYALTLTVGLLALLLAAGSLAAERDENVIGRLPATIGELLAAKVALGAVVAATLGTAMALAFGIVIETAAVRGGEPWQRIPLVTSGLVLAGASLGALGCLVAALARDARTALLAAVALALPLAFVAVVPSDAVRVAGAIGSLFPVVHALRFFSAALYDVSPWRTLAAEAAWLVAITAVLWALARIAARRLLV